jgi:uncharacterized protein
MKPRDFDPVRLDVEAFAKAEGFLQGQWPVAELGRLAGSAFPGTADGEVSWQARGESRPKRGGGPDIWLHVEAHASLRLECQRCLGPVDTPIEAQRSFLFVQGEDAAAELDADHEEDVLALTRSLDLRELVEDELLLALPLVPRHEACPEPLVAPVDTLPEGEEKPNPFAVLAALKRDGRPN